MRDDKTNRWLSEIQYSSNNITSNYQLIIYHLSCLNKQFFQGVKAIRVFHKGFVWDEYHAEDLHTDTNQVLLGMGGVIRQSRKVKH